MDKKQFERWVHRFGQTSSFILLLMMVAFPIIVSAVYGEWPNFAQIWPGILTVILILAPWWPSETIGYMPTMGPGALYQSYITGNVTNLRMPATIGTMNAIGLEPNTDGCHTMAIIACGASNFVTVILLFLGLLLAVPLQPLLYSESLQPAFNQAIPALFGGLIAQSVLKNKKQVLLYIPLAVIAYLLYLTGLNGAYVMLIVLVLGAVEYCMLDYYIPKKTGRVLFK